MADHSEINHHHHHHYYHSRSAARAFPIIEDGDAESPRATGNKHAHQMTSPSIMARQTRDAPTTLDLDAAPEPHMLFHYVPAYRVLICKRCCYAIQPSAIHRHLKEIHQIFRTKRRPFIEFIQDLSLDDPEDVLAPAAVDFPIPYLPVERGWRCKATACDYKCVSDKRMEMHWPAVHGTKGRANEDFTCVPLQTWFRGNMLRYFAGPVDDTPVISIELDQKLATTHPVLVLRRLVIQNYDVDDLGAEILDYFFSRTYYTILIDTAEHHPSLSPWLGILPRLALDFRFIFDGIMALGYMHKAHLDHKRRGQLRIRAAAHQDSAIPAFRQAVDQPSKSNCEAILVYGYMLIVMYFTADDGVEPYEPSFTVQGDRFVWGIWYYCIRSAYQIVAQIWELVEPPLTDFVASPNDHELVDTEWQASQWPRLSDLMAAIPSDDSWSDAEKLVYAENATSLVICFQRIERLRKDPAATGIQLFSEMAMWPFGLSDDGHELLCQQHPGLLILLAHWCVLLHGLDHVWFLRYCGVRGFEFCVMFLNAKYHPFLERARQVMHGTGVTPLDGDVLMGG